MSTRGFDSAFLDKIRQTNDIVSTISNYAYVTRKGRNFWCNCPFHHEKTPSLCINDSEQFFHCFGCGVSGDVITFIMKIESMDFYDAVKLLAQKANLELPEMKDNKEIELKKKKRDRIYALLEDAKNHYRQNLSSEKAVLANEYIQKRELSSEDVNDFEIGYSLGYENIVSFLKSKGYTKEEMMDAGMISEKDGRIYDFFAGRLMFPIVDKFNHTIGFSGRALNSDAFAKYKNSPQTEAFDKSNTVFAINLVKKEKQKNGIKSVIICEGQMDVIAMHKAGFKNTVACMGTALTPNHAREISRLADKVILCLDGDSAGKNATMKAIPVLLEQKLEVRVALLPGGKDPDEILKEKGKEHLRQYLMSAVDSMEFRIMTLAEQTDLKDGKNKARFLSQVVALLNTLATNAEKQVYIELVARLTGASPQILARDLIENNVKFVSQTEELKSSEDSLLKAQKFVLASILHNKDYAKDRFELYLKNPSFIKLIELIDKSRQNGEEFKPTKVYDLFNEESDSDVIELVTYNFDRIGDECNVYYKQSKNKILLFGLENKQRKLTQMFPLEKDIEQKRKILSEIQIITNEIKKLKSEDNK